MEILLLYDVLAYSAIAVGFASSIDLAKRERVMELLAVLRNCSLTYMSFAVLLLVFKNPMIDSRYLFIGSYLLFILFSCLGRYVLKRVLTNNFSNSRNATLVGVVATRTGQSSLCNRCKRTGPSG